MSEHAFMIAALILIAFLCAFNGALVYRVYRKSDHLEGIIAATYLEARRALSQYRP
jgi:hypothetical protein